jgi:inner membrane protein
MDSLTQIVLGIAVAEAVAGNTLKNRTFLYGAVLGTLPDLDVLVGKLLPDVQAVDIHRGISHSLLLFLLLSPLLGRWLVQLEKKRISFARATLLVFLCLFTHVILDVFTTWGTQVLWPLPERFALKTIFVIDPLYTLPLIIALLCVWRTTDTTKRLRYVKRGLLWSSTYLLLTVGLKLFALQQFEKALDSQQVSYTEIIVKPTALNTIVWNANVKVANGYLIGNYSLFDTQPITFTTYPSHPELEQTLLDVPDFKKLQRISEGWYIVTEEDGKLYFNDLRFGLLNRDPDAPIFVFRYEFQPYQNGLRAVEVKKENRNGKELLINIFKRMKGN